MTASQYEGVWWGASAALEMATACQTAMATLTRYANAYGIPFIIASTYFNKIESQRFWTRTPDDNFLAYMKLCTMNMALLGRAINGDMHAVDRFLAMGLEHCWPSLTTCEPRELVSFAKRMHNMTRQLAYTFPAAVEGIESEFGFHFERQPPSTCIDETDRFLLYQVLPNDPKVTIRENGKPIMIIPPFVLGANILAFLPLENRSYAHAFANQGFPTYVRIIKDIRHSEAVQVMTPEDDALDTRRFCEAVKARHGQPLTLNGYCQGGYAALCNLLSGELDGLVDAFITCVSPMDGSRSKGLAKFLQELPAAFNDLAYGTKTLANGHQVADGALMGWIYKLKSIETETPLLSMWRDLLLVSKCNSDPAGFNKTAAALNHWLTYERGDLPLAITRVSFDAYNIPISKEGVLPVKLFDRSLNIKRIQEKKIPWLICYGKQDDLVEPETALAPVDYVDAEITGFPKGHVAIATSWSHPDSAYALHMNYKEDDTRGPVRFHMDLQEVIDQARQQASQAKIKSSVMDKQPVSVEPKPASVEVKTSSKTKTSKKKKEADK